jgi:hypothetical protein
LKNINKILKKKRKNMGKRKYERPSVTTVVVGNELLTTISGQHNPGTNNGPGGDAKENNFYFDDEEE